jgi:Protein of unknown function (DUF3551)
MSRKARLALTAAVAGLLAIGVLTYADGAKADPYRWCAEYGGGRGGSTNCYFVTLEQCRATVFGNGGFCRPNTFYTGDDRPRRRTARSYS